MSPSSDSLCAWVFLFVSTESKSRESDRVRGMADRVDQIFELEEAVKVRGNLDKIPELLQLKLSSEYDRLLVCDADNFRSVQGGIEQLHSMLESITGSRGEVYVKV